MTINEIDAFLAIYHCGTMAAASRQLFITQPTLSRRIQSLEAELGYKLMDRSKGHQKIELTPKGEQFAHLAGNWKAMWEDMVNLPQASNDISYRLHFSAVNSLVSNIIYPAVYSFIEDHPNVKINLESQHSYNAYPRVRSGILDGAFVTNTFYNSSIRAHSLWTEPMAIVLGPAIDASSIKSPVDLDITSEIRVEWNHEYREWHNYWFSDKKQYKLTIDQIPAVEHMMKDNPDLWIIAPVSAAIKICRSGVLNYIMMDCLPSREVSYISKNEQVSPAMRDFLLHLRKIISDIPYVKVSDPTEWLNLAT